jgi:cystathionine beta-lyase/cystathionine gamma-synthase
VVDLSAVAEVVRAVQPGVLIVADNTFATPYLQNPLTLGATLVVHSGSKYLGGHNDLLAGAVAGPSDLIGRIRETQILLGGILDPHGAWLLQRGIRTLGLRVQRASDTALFLATWLASQPGIVRVNYPWLGADGGSIIARRQMRAGGAMISFEVDGGLEGARRFVNALRDIAIATSLGGVETVVEVPYELDWHESEGIAGSEVPPGLIRLSVGIEDPRDLQCDLANGVAALAGATEAVR